MYSVFKAGGHQYKVEKGDVLTIDKQNGKIGDDIIFDKVLLFKKEDLLEIGHPYVNGVSVKAEIIDQTKNPKIIIFKYKRRKNYKVTRGHKQEVTKIKIKEFIVDMID